MKTGVASAIKLQFFQGLAKVKTIYFTQLKNRHFLESVVIKRHSGSNKPSIKLTAQFRMVVQIKYH